jgi:hypothetical protein
MDGTPRANRWSQNRRTLGRAALQKASFEEADFLRHTPSRRAFPFKETA